MKKATLKSKNFLDKFTIEQSFEVGDGRRGNELNAIKAVGRNLLLAYKYKSAKLAFFDKSRMQPMAWRGWRRVCKHKSRF